MLAPGVEIAVADAPSFDPRKTALVLPAVCLEHRVVCLLQRPLLERTYRPAACLAVERCAVAVLRADAACLGKGEPLWSFAAQQCSVLYLCLEDSYQRIRCRLLDLTENAPDTLHFSIIAEQLQRVRGSGDSGNPYANDYRDIGALKALADKHRIAILLVHHIRKLKSDDPMDMISGTNGISGATDTNFVLMKTSRSKSTATLYCTGRDIEYRELNLEFGSETHFWNLLSDNSPSVEQPDGQMLSLLSALLRQQSEISGTAATLLKIIDPTNAEGLTPNLLSRQIRKNVDTLGKNGIMVSFRKSNGERLIRLKRADRDANITTANTDPIDPAAAVHQ